MSEHDSNSDATLDKRPLIPRVQVARKTVEVQRPTVEVEGHPLSEGFPVLKVTVEVTRGSDASMVKTFEKGVIRIGADPLVDVVLTDPTVSRAHAEVRVKSDGSAFELVDMDSTNGTYVDGSRVALVELPAGAEFQVGRTKMRVSVATEQVKIAVTDRTRYGSIIGQSQALREIFSILDRVAPSELSIVIEGETGSGKELIAAAIHEHSARANKPFVVFDCSAFPATLLESELFGHEKGAFSGATNRHRGVFERADGGTIFFDELGEMDIEFQAKFLRVLETGDVRRVGGESTFHVDVRVVAATNRNLEELVAERKFRQDLFYRLAKVRFNLPPLRSRPEDIPLLAEHFLIQLAGEHNARPLMTEDALRTLQAYPWPGNIRQLRNVVEKAVAMCTGGVITADYLRSELKVAPSAQLSPSEPVPLSAPHRVAPTAPAAPELVGNRVHLTAVVEGADGEFLPFRDAKDALIEDFEKVYLERLLQINKQNISRAARQAQIDRRHLYRLLKKHGLMED